MKKQNLLTRLGTITFALFTLFSCTTNEQLNEDVLSSENTSLAVVSGNKYYLKGNNGMYVSHENGSKDIICNRENSGSWEQFYLREDSGAWSIAGVSTNLYVSSENGAKDITCNRTGLGAWEKFDVEYNGTANGNDVVAFKSKSNSLYISSENGTKDMTCNRSAIGAWEKFELVPVDGETIEVNPDAINLNLRVHIIQDSWTHPSGIELSSWVTPNDVNQVIMPEVNQIWSSSNIVWNVESIIQEPIYEFDGYEDSIDYVLNAVRNSLGQSDSNRLPHLYNLMQPEYKSTNEELGTNLFHIYLFPFTGNTSQGNAMRSYGFHSVLGTWTNKYSSDGLPVKTLLTEDQDAFAVGSLSRTIAHEVGHVLGLTHSDCTNCLMQGEGYSLTDDQILTAESLAKSRL